MLLKKIGTILLAGAVFLASGDIKAFAFFKKKKPFKRNELLQVPSPINTVVVFDLHDVLFEWDKAAFQQQFTLSKKKSQHGLMNRIGATVALPFVAVGAKITKKPLGYFYKTSFLKGLKYKYVEIAGCYKPNNAMFELIKELKAAGYTVMLASNVDQDSLADLKKRFPVLQNVFDQELYPSVRNQWVNKNKPKKFYRQLKELASGKQIVFIDDKEKNCRNAQDYGIDVAVQFVSVDQLRQVFKTLNLSN